MGGAVSSLPSVEGEGARAKTEPAREHRAEPSEEPTQMNPRIDEAENLLTPSEVAALFRVDPKTVTRWAKAGKIGSIRTLGGHRRFRESEVRQLLEADGSK